MRLLLQAWWIGWETRHLAPPIVVSSRRATKAGTNMHHRGALHDSLGEAYPAMARNLLKASVLALGAFFLVTVNDSSCKKTLQPTVRALDQVSQSRPQRDTAFSSLRCGRLPRQTFRESACFGYTLWGPGAKGQQRRLAQRDSCRRAGGSPSAASTLSYYLLWSPGLLQRTVVIFVAMLSLQLYMGRHFSVPAPLRVSATVSLFSHIWHVFLLPLLSSACCGLQLVINVLVGAGGCAGFNKRLGPLRPFFLGAMLSTAAVSVIQRHAHVRLLIFQCFLAFLPESW